MLVDREELIARRRALRIAPFRTLEDVGFDGDWVTPYQISSCSPDGPVLLALHWLDELAIEKHRSVLTGLGYLPGIRFNNVLDLALASRGMDRSDIYVTQAFLLIPQSRSQAVPEAALLKSFREVTLWELQGRRVIALGAVATAMCKAHDVDHVSVCHPSRRGRSNAANAEEIARGFEAVGC